MVGIQLGRQFDVAACVKCEEAQSKVVCSRLEPPRPAVDFVRAQLGGAHLCTTRRRDGEQDAQCGNPFHGGILCRVKEWAGEVLAISHLPPVS